MVATRLKEVVGWNRCCRCQEDRQPHHECRFAFPESYAYWKGIWQARTGKRLTNRRKRHLAAAEGDIFDLTALSKIVYWMFLCDRCWEECSTAPCPGFPQEFWEEVLRCRSGEKFVPTKMAESASGSSGVSFPVSTYKGS
jgi:hypothetical protein